MPIRKITEPCAKSAGWDLSKNSARLLKESEEKYTVPHVDETTKSYSPTEDNLRHFEFLEKKTNSQNESLKGKTGSCLENQTVGDACQKTGCKHMEYDGVENEYLKTNLFKGGFDDITQSPDKSQGHLGETVHRWQGQSQICHASLIPGNKRVHSEGKLDLKCNNEWGRSKNRRHTTIKQMFESILQSINDTVLPTSDASTSDLDQLASIMGENNSSILDDKSQRSDTDCSATIINPANIAPDPNEPSGSTEDREGVQKSTRSRKQPEASDYYDNVEILNQEWSPIPKETGHNGSILQFLDTQGGPCRSNDTCEDSPASSSLFLDTKRKGRASRKDTSRDKLSRAFSFPLTRVTSAARSFLGRVRAHSSSPAKGRGAFESIIGGGKKFVRRSRDAILALGCISYETDSDQSELTEREERLRRRRMCLNNDKSFQNRQKSERDFGQVREESNDDTQSNISDDISYQISTVSSLVGFFEKIEQEVALKQKTLIKRNEPRHKRLQCNAENVSSDMESPASFKHIKNLADDDDLEREIISLDSLDLQDGPGEQAESKSKISEFCPRGVRAYDDFNVRDHESEDASLEIHKARNVYSCPQMDFDEIDLKEDRCSQKVSNFAVEGPTDALPLKMSSISLSPEVCMMNTKRSSGIERSLSQNTMTFKQEEKDECFRVAVVPDIVVSPVCDKQEEQTAIISDGIQRSEKLSPDEQPSCEGLNVLEFPPSAPPPNSPKFKTRLDGPKVVTTVSLFETRSLLCNSNPQEAEMDEFVIPSSLSKSAQAFLETAFMPGDEEESSTPISHACDSAETSQNIEEAKLTTDTKVEVDIDPNVNNTQVNERSDPQNVGVSHIYKSLNMKSDFFTRFGDEDTCSSRGRIMERKCGLLDIRSNSAVVFSGADDKRELRSSSYSAPQFSGTQTQHGLTGRDVENWSKESDREHRSNLLDGALFPERERQVGESNLDGCMSDSVRNSVIAKTGESPSHNTLEKLNCYLTFSKLPDDLKKLEAIYELPSPPNISPSSSKENVHTLFKPHRFEDRLKDSPRPFNSIASSSDGMLQPSSQGYEQSQRTERRPHELNHLSDADPTLEENNLQQTTVSDLSENKESIDFTPSLRNSYETPVNPPVVIIEDCSSSEEEDRKAIEIEKKVVNNKTTRLMIEDKHTQMQMPSCSTLANSDHIGYRWQHYGYASGKSTEQKNGGRNQIENLNSFPVTGTSSSMDGRGVLVSDKFRKNVSKSEMITSKGTFESENQIKREVIAQGDEPTEEDQFTSSSTPISTILRDIVGNIPDSGASSSRKKQLLKSPRYVRWDVDSRRHESSSEPTSLSTDEDDCLHTDRCNSCLTDYAHDFNGHWCNHQVLQMRPIHIDLTGEAHGKTYFNQQNDHVLACCKNNMTLLEHAPSSYWRYSKFLQPGTCTDSWSFGTLSWYPHFESRYSAKFEALLKRLLALMEKFQMSITRSPLLTVPKSHENNLSSEDDVLTHIVQNQNKVNVPTNSMNVKKNPQQRKMAYTVTDFCNANVNSSAFNKNVRNRFGEKTRNKPNMYHIAFDDNLKTLNKIVHCVSASSSQLTLHEIDSILDDDAKCAQNLTDTDSKARKTSPGMADQGSLAEISGVNETREQMRSYKLSHHHPIPKPDGKSMDCILSPLPPMESLSQTLEESHVTIVKTLNFVERAQRRIAQCDALIDKSLNTLRRSTAVSRRCQHRLEAVDRLLGLKSRRLGKLQHLNSKF